MSNKDPIFKKKVKHLCYNIGDTVMQVGPLTVMQNIQEEKDWQAIQLNDHHGCLSRGIIVGFSLYIV